MGGTQSWPDERVIRPRVCFFKFFILKIFMNEIWLRSDVEPGIEVSSFGGVRLFSTKSPKRIVLNHKGYKKVNIGYRKKLKSGLKIGKMRRYFLHRLIAFAFIPNPDNHPQINHINGDKTNNHVDNLEWCTARHNVSEQIRMGRHNRAGKRQLSLF
jgi:hypothetical protein